MSNQPEPEPQILYTLDCKPTDVTSLSVCPASKYLIAGQSDSTINVWDLSKPCPSQKVLGHSKAVTSTAIHPSGRLFASSSADSTVRIYTLGKEGQHQVIKAHQNQHNQLDQAINQVAFSKSGDNFITASSDCTSKIFATHTRKMVSQFKHHKQSVNSAIFSNDSYKVITGSDDCTVGVFDVPQNKFIFDFKEHTKSVNNVLYHPNNVCIASCSSDQSVNLYDLRTNHVIQHQKGDQDGILSLAFSQSGRYLMSGSRDGAMQIQDTIACKVLYTMQAHSGPINDIVQNENEGEQITGSNDGNLHVWKWDSLNEKFERNNWVNQTRSYNDLKKNFSVSQDYNSECSQFNLDELSKINQSSVNTVQNFDSKKYVNDVSLPIQKGLNESHLEIAQDWTGFIKNDKLVIKDKSEINNKQIYVKEENNSFENNSFKNVNNILDKVEMINQRLLSMADDLNKMSKRVENIENKKIN